jgi:hypothetical protein
MDVSTGNYDAYLTKIIRRFTNSYIETINIHLIVLNVLYVVNLTEHF